MVKEIRASVKCTPKINQIFYSFEYCETRSVEEGISEKELSKEKADLWDTCFNEVMNQVNMTIEESQK